MPSRDSLALHTTDLAGFSPISNGAKMRRKPAIFATLWLLAIGCQSSQKIADRLLGPGDPSHRAYRGCWKCGSHWASCSSNEPTENWITAEAKYCTHHWTRMSRDEWDELRRDVFETKQNEVKRTRIIAKDWLIHHVGPQEKSANAQSRD